MVAARHDENVKANAAWREKAGFDYYLVRDAGGGCCPWCQALEGRYEYASAPEAATATRLTPEQAEAINEQSKATVNTPEQAKELESKVLDKSGKNSIINPEGNRIQISMQHFGKRAEDFETFFLPKDEYAHVMSEIASNLTEEQASKRVIKKHIGDYIYTVENKGFGNLRVIGKDLIE